MAVYDLLQLSDEQWRTESTEYPSDYGGYWPGREGYLRVGIGRSRDSDTLEESNYIAAFNMLTETAEEHGIQDRLPDEMVPVLEHSASHWAVGWVESLWVADVPEMREAVRSIWQALEHYPVLDDSDYSEREYEAWTETIQDAIAAAFYSHALPDDLEWADDLSHDDQQAIGWKAVRWLEPDTSPEYVPYDDIAQRIHTLLTGGRTDVDTGEPLHTPRRQEVRGQLKLGE